MNEIRFIISLSARSTQQVHKRFFHIFSLSLFCRPSFYPFLLLLTSPVSKAHRRFGQAQSRENWHLRSFFPVNSAPPCWKIGRNRHQDRSALSSFSFLRSLRVTFEGLAVWGVFFLFFFYRGSNDEQVRDSALLPALSKRGQRKNTHSHI